ncbi:MAG: MltA domain-containing protein [Magnetococcales bacterium]|nr:MltA domain-containing protein [Magnetococcales bacterium]
MITIRLDRHWRHWQRTLLLLSGLIITLATALHGCAPREAPPVVTPPVVEAPVDESYGAVEGPLQRVPWSRLKPALADGLKTTEQMRQWATALDRSAQYYGKIAPETTFRFGLTDIPARRMAAACRELAAVAKTGTSEQLWQLLTSKYQLYRSIGVDGKGNVLVTGYFEPLLNGSRTPSARFRYPVYRSPRTRGLSPKLYDRNAIENKGKLAKKGLELAWVDDRIALFFLHIQGSGRIRMEDGSILRVGYDGGNGHPYFSIGNILIQEKHLIPEEVTMPGIRRWLLDHPREINRILISNQNYVFFRPVYDGPYGNINVMLTPWHSIATDYHLFPKGAPAVIETRRPSFASDGSVTEWRPETRLVVNQDTGGAIRGAGRVDWFTGFGRESELTAGVMKQNRSGLYFIVPIINR